MNRIAPFVILALAAVAVFAFSVLTPAVSAQEPNKGAVSDAVADGVVAMYFHGNARCATCRKIESYADEAISQGFVDELESGRLTWRVVNIDESANKHFIEDFQLVTRSVVLVEYRDGKVLRWENLDKVWQLVRSKDKFVSYVDGETREFLGTS
jgi:hypothetical protein